MSSRRGALEGLEPVASTHVGLWLDSGVPGLGEKGESKQDHLERVLRDLRVPAGYREHYARWRRLVAGCPPCTVLAEATVEGRMVVGLGAESVLETAITLHRAYGVPYLPGPALKGLAAAAAHRHLADGDAWRKGGKDRPAGAAHREMFGEQESGGAVTFHDALWIPGSGDLLPLDLDVTTVHHAGFYQGQGVPPADWDDPNPVAFLSARGSYLLAVTGPGEWARAALAILAGALAEDGIGAKTAAGYGRLRVATPVEPGGSGGGAAAGEAPSWEARVKAVQLGNADREVPRLLAGLAGGQRRRAARRIVEHLGRKALREPKRRDREWVKDLLAAAAEEEGSDEPA